MRRPQVRVADDLQVCAQRRLVVLSQYTLITLAPQEGLLSKMNPRGGLKRKGSLRDVLALGHVYDTTRSAALEVRARSARNLFST